MPVTKFRSVEEMNTPVWRRPGDPALFRAIARLWDLGRRTSTRRLVPGIQKHASIDALSAAQARNADIVNKIRRAAKEAGGLILLVLHGSRATGTNHAHSDWDFAFVGDAAFDADTLLARLGEAVHSDAIDLADLSRASGLLRFNVASDGIVVFERLPGTFDQFRLDAISTWLDMVPVLGPAYDARLEQLGK